MERQPISILIAAPTKNTFIKDRQISAENPYVKKLSRLNITPIIASPDMSQNQVDDLYGTTSGILIPGGTDIEPWRYGQEPHAKLMKPLNPQLDEFQIKLVHKTTTDNKPLLGICRGEQIMTVAHGGTLHQHLPDVMPHENHGLSVNEQGETQDRNIFHDVYLSKHSESSVQTKAHIIFRTKKLLSVPTKHHQAVDNPGTLLITGKSPGGIAEIIEHPTLDFHIGVQFHPELSENKKITEIFRSFANAAANYSEYQKPLLPFIPSQSQNPIAI